jgi:hypothetical protein
MRLSLICVVVFSLVGPALAANGLTSPYRDQAATAIRALTQKEIEDLRIGRGMGLARAAELNSYPGPRHVLDAAQAGQLHLTPVQGRTIQGLFDGMSREAQRLGALILKEEQNLEIEFQTGRITEADLQARVARIAALQGQLRAVHLKTHVATRAALTEQQVQHYNELRGYSAGSPQQPEHHNRH